MQRYLQSIACFELQPKREFALIQSFNSFKFIQQVFQLPIAKAFIAQLFGGISVLIASWFLPNEIISAVPLLMWTLIAGSIAALFGVLYGMAFWWGAINVFFLPSVYLSMGLMIPGGVFFILFTFLVVVYWNSAQGIPIYLTNSKTCQGLAGLLPCKPKIKFIDIGCGFGGTLGYLSYYKKSGIFRGIESAPIPFAISRFLLLITGQRNIRLKFGNMWKLNLSEFDVVYAFLSPVPMERLFEKVRAEMKPGSIFISNSFKVPNEKPTETIEIDDRRKTKLLVWRL
jgi:hypothetical protein